MAFFGDNYPTVIFIITIFCAVCEGKPPSKIIGGTDASIYDWPSIVSLRLNGRHFCGGSFITKCHVLTAAHCVFQINMNGMKIASGSTDQETFRHLYGIKKVDIHPNYIGISNLHLDDIAVITLATCIVEDSTQRVAQLYGAPLGNRVGGTVVGWGQLYNHVRLTSQHLQRLDSWTIMNYECINSYNAATIRPSQVCTINLPGTGLCSADSGGPFYVNNQIAGIVSMGSVCGVGIPDIYTRVFNYIPWIQSKINPISSRQFYIA